MSTSYLVRLIDPLVDELLASFPAILLTGPRATGKTTTARRHARTVVRLDRPDEVTAVDADPDDALIGLSEPILLDEWQVVPSVLGAVKRSVDSDSRPGRFLLTGSVNADLRAPTWPGTGRVLRVPMVGLTVRETQGRVPASAFLDRVAEHGADGLQVPSDPPSLRGYVDLALASGFPDAVLRHSGADRARWLHAYVEQLLTRDVEHVDGGRDPERLRRHVEGLALNTAGVVQHKTLCEAARITVRTGEAYDHLLANLLITEALPAWSTNRLKRLTRAPKRHVIDPALAASILRVDHQGIVRDGNLLGRILDSFVTAQIRAELPVCSTMPRLYHLRTEGGRQEIDLIAELGGNRVIAIEIKAHSAPDAGAVKHLAWLRNELGERFIWGLVLHTGPRMYTLGDRLTAAPIATLWG